MTIEAPKEMIDIYLPDSATLLETEPMTQSEKYFKFRYDDDGDHAYQPGQFMEVSLPGIGEVPISISSSPTRNGDGTLEMVIRKTGSVTGALHTLEPGAKVGLRGPFGTTFPVEAMKGRSVLFVTGGIGLVPVRSAINYVIDNRDDYKDVTVLFGTRSPSERLFTKELQQWDARDDITFAETVDVGDSSWTGNVGVITTLIPEVSIDAINTTVIVCGPPVMYKFVLLELRKLNVPYDNIYLSLERHMRCGVGKCGHCQINALYVCQDGPVFNYGEVADLKEAI